MVGLHFFLQRTFSAFFWFTFTWSLNYYEWINLLWMTFLWSSGLHMFFSQGFFSSLFFSCFFWCLYNISPAMEIFCICWPECILAVHLHPAFRVSICLFFLYRMSNLDYVFGMPLSFVPGTQFLGGINIYDWKLLNIDSIQGEDYE